MPDRQLPIGVFDSGAGGLSVLNTLKLALPHENFVYYGDTANVPYGDKSVEELTPLTKRIVRFLCEEHKIKLLVIACNSSSAIVPGYLGEFGDLPCITPVEPVANHVKRHDWWDEVGVLATRRTVDSGIYAERITAASKHVSVFQTACPGLVDLIEAGKANSTECRELSRQFARQLADLCDEPDAIVLGCTHYPFVAHHIRTMFAPKTMILNPEQLMADAAYDWLDENELMNDKQKSGEVTYFISGKTDAFLETVKHLPLPYLGKIEAKTLEPEKARI